MLKRILSCALIVFSVVSLAIANEGNLKKKTIKSNRSNTEIFTEEQIFAPFIKSFNAAVDAIWNGLKNWVDKMSNTVTQKSNWVGFLYSFILYAIFAIFFFNLAENFYRTLMRQKVLSFKYAGVQMFSNTWGELDRKTERINRVQMYSITINVVNLALLIAFIPSHTPLLGLIYAVLLMVGMAFYLFIRIGNLFFSQKPYYGAINHVVHDISTALISIGCFIMAMSLYLFYVDTMKVIPKDTDSYVYFSNFWNAITIVAFAFLFFLLKTSYERRNKDENLVEFLIEKTSKFHEKISQRERKNMRLFVIGKGLMIWIFIRKIFYNIGKFFFDLKENIVMFNIKIMKRVAEFKIRFLKKIMKTSLKNLFNRSMMVEILLFSTLTLLPIVLTHIKPNAMYDFFTKVNKIIVHVGWSFPIGVAIFMYSLPCFFASFGFLSVLSEKEMNDLSKDNKKEEKAIRLFGQIDNEEATEEDL